MPEDTAAVRPPGPQHLARHRGLPFGVHRHGQIHKGRVDEWNSIGEEGEQDVGAAQAAIAVSPLGRVLIRGTGQKNLVECLVHVGAQSHVLRYVVLERQDVVSIGGIVGMIDAPAWLGTV